MIVTNIVRKNIDIYLANSGQNEVGSALKKFASIIPEIKDIEDIEKLYSIFKNEFHRDKNNVIKKFTRTSEQIAESKIFSGCSDVGTLVDSVKSFMETKSY